MYKYALKAIGEGDIINQVNISMNHKSYSEDGNNLPLNENKYISLIVSKQVPGSSLSSIPSFESYMELPDAFNLKVKDKIDHRDKVGKFVYATVSEKQGTNLKIYDDGWPKRWETWSDFTKELHRFAKAGSISKKQRIDLRN